MHKQRFFILVIGLAGFMGTFSLPWMKNPFTGLIYGKDEFYGWITAGLFIVLPLVALLGQRELALSKRSRWIELIVSLIILIFNALYIFDILRFRLGGPLSQAFSAIVPLGPGNFINCALAIITVILAVSFRNKENNHPASSRSEH